jgi:hypothetical protein
MTFIIWAVNVTQRKRTMILLFSIFPPKNILIIKLFLLYELKAETCFYKVGINSKRFEFGASNFKTFYALIAHHREKGNGIGICLDLS